MGKALFYVLAGRAARIFVCLFVFVGLSLGPAAQQPVQAGAGNAVSAGQLTGGIHFRLDTAGAISGYVYEAGGTTPVAGAHVVANRIDQNDHIAEAFTDALGFYTIEGLEAHADYRVQASAAGYLTSFYPHIPRFPQAALVNVQPGETTSGVDITLIKADSFITGRVTYQDNSPAANVWMEAFHQDGWFVGLNADANGEYVLPVIAGTWQVFPHEPPKVVLERNVTVGSGETVANIDFTFDQAGTISGRITDLQGIPLANIRVSLDGPIMGSGTCTNANGEYVFTAALDVEWRVRASPVGSNACGGSNAYAFQYYSNTQLWDRATLITLTAQAPARSMVDFSLKLGGGVTGRVFEADGVTPAAGVCIAFFDNPHSEDQLANWGSTAADGSFTIWGLAPLPVYIRTRVGCQSDTHLRDEWYTPIGSTIYADKATPLTIIQGQLINQVNFQLNPAGSLSGRVFQQGGVTPIPGAWVYALDNAFQYIAGANTQADGSYRIRSLPTGSYHIAVQAGGFGGVYYPNGYDDTGSTKVLVTAPGETPDINFNLSPEATLTGTVLQSNGTTPIAGALIEVWPSLGGQIHQTHSAADGSFTVYGLSSGQYVAMAAANGFETEYFLDGYNVPTATRIPIIQPNNTPDINFTLSAPVGPPDSERQALISLYQATGGASWYTHFGWSTASNVCTWVRVTCHDGHVTGLNLNQNNLSGPLPVSLADLPELRLLYLNQNNLSGAIPTQLGSIARLAVLRLNDNQLSGAIPDALMNLTYLLNPGESANGEVGLDLSFNRLTVPEPYPSTPPSALETFLLQKDPDWQDTQSTAATIPTEGGTLTARDGDTTITIPAESLPEETTFDFIPQEVPSQQTGALAFAGNSFQLEAQDAQGEPMETFNFAHAVTLAMQYTDADIAGIDETTLRIAYWDSPANAWLDAASTCAPNSVYTRDLTANTLSVDVCHLSEFAVLGVREGTVFVFLPIVRR